MRANSMRRTSIKKNSRKKFYLSKRKSLKKTFRKKQIRKRKSIKKGGARKKRSTKQKGGSQTSQAIQTTQAQAQQSSCDSSTKTTTIDNNKNVFLDSFSITNTTPNNTPPPTCNFVGENSSGTMAHSCV